MDFFANQDMARRKTKYLVGLFLIAVIIIIGLANVIIAFCLWLFTSGTSHSSLSLNTYFSWKIFSLVSLVVNGVIFLAVIYKWHQLSEGGKHVAETLGGERILPTTVDFRKKRALNVVEEMALASGMPVPSVYLLAREKGINAFAAGNSPADAVIGITQGGLDSFNREQLQGVIAHEFSHILNGDMRLNLRLIALLNGILFLGHCGRFLLRSGGFSSRSSRKGGGGRILILAVGLAVVGAIGTFLGGLIKAAINRQREFLADASAVQFTRNPGGIGGALKVIGGHAAGSRLLSANTDEASHIFVSNALGSFAFFRTHPPLEDRIRRIDPHWDGEMIKIPYRKPKQEKPAADKKKRAMAASAAILATVLGGGEDQANQQEKKLLTSIPQSLLDKLQDPFSASSALYAMLLDSTPTIRASQLELIKENGAQGADSLSLSLQKELTSIDQSLRLAIIDQCMPALKCMSVKQYKIVLQTLKKLIQADKKIDLFEWCLYSLVRHYLGAEYGNKKVIKPRFKSAGDIHHQYSIVLSTLIHHCHLDPSTAKRAFSRGATTVGLYSNTLLPKNDCSMKEFRDGVKAMAECYPLLKARLLKGLVNVVEFDKEITPLENEIITTIAAVMDCPLPRTYHLSIKNNGETTGT